MNKKKGRKTFPNYRLRQYEKMLTAMSARKFFATYLDPKYIHIC